MGLIYLSPVPWDSFHQRPHEFVKWASSKKNKVLWIDPYPTRLPRLNDFIRVLRIGTGNKVIENQYSWLKVIRPISLPIEPLSEKIDFINYFLWRSIFITINDFIKDEDCTLGIGKPSKLAIKILSKFDFNTTFYDSMDDFSEFYQGLSRISMKKIELKVSAKVSCIFSSSTYITNRLLKVNPNTIMVNNACNIDPLTECNAGKNDKSVCTIGYVGTIGDWFDWPLVISIAKIKPFIIIQIIGPILTKLPKSMPENIKLISSCNHSDAITIMQNFSIGLIPFKDTKLTRSVDPIKYYEYKALGLPVLSTCIGEMNYRKNEPGVYFLDRCSDLSLTINKALLYQPDCNEVLQFREKNTWSKRFDSVSYII